MGAEIIFWVSATILAYSYLLYPLIAIPAAKAKIKKPAAAPDTCLPTISVIMAVYNESKVISKKIKSLLSTDYPAERLEIIIGSDASDDGTDEVISTYAGDEKRIRFIRSEMRRGKSAMINKLAEEAGGEILIITDANVMLQVNTVRMLAGRFTDPHTGLCDATVKTKTSESQGIAFYENSYSRFETTLKRAEGDAWGTMTGPYGGCYAVRRHLLPVLPENMLCDDLFIGLKVLQSGFNVINEPGAVVSEDTNPEVKGQFMRRSRIAAGSFQNLFHFGPFPGKGIHASFCFFSHKVLRWATPLLLLLVFMTTVILSRDSISYFCLLAAQLFFILLSALDMALGLVKINLRPLRFATQFLMMNAALVAGFMKALKGVKRGTWEPTKRY